MLGLHSQPPVKPARRTPLTMHGQYRINRHNQPLRLFSTTRSKTDKGSIPFIRAKPSGPMTWSDAFPILGAIRIASL